MRARALLEFPAMDLAVALALPLVYLATSFRCAAMVACYLREATACLFVCVNPITQVPGLLFFGAVFGLLPATGATVLFLARTPVPNETRIARVGFPITTLLLAIPGFAFIFAPGGILLGLLSLPLAAAFLIAFNLAIFPDWRAALRS